jgi:hypothetical protein
MPKQTATHPHRLYPPLWISQYIRSVFFISFMLYQFISYTNQQHTPQFIPDLMVLWSFYEAVVLRQNITQLALCDTKLWAVPNFMNCFETSRWMHTSLAANTINNVPSAQFKWRQLPTSPPLDASYHGRHGEFAVYFTRSLSSVDGRKLGWKRPWRKRANILGFVWRQYRKLKPQSSECATGESNWVHIEQKSRKKIQIFKEC